MKYEITYLEWDSDFFKKSCERATIYEKLTESEMQSLLDECKKYEFVTIDNDCGEMYNCSLLGRLSSAFLTDCPVLLEKVIPPEFTADICEIKVASPDEAQALALLANGAFSVSRFGSDPNIAPEKVDELYRNWVINSFNNPNKTVLTTKTLGGFLTVKLNGHIDLIAVDKNRRGCGIGVKLLAAAEDIFRKNGLTTFQVGTQSRNISALRLYIKFGFRIIKTSQIYHLYNNKQSDLTDGTVKL